MEKQETLSILRGIQENLEKKRIETTERAGSGSMKRIQRLSYTHTPDFWQRVIDEALVGAKSVEEATGLYFALDVVSDAIERVLDSADDVCADDLVMALHRLCSAAEEIAERVADMDEWQ